MKLINRLQIVLATALIVQVVGSSADVDKVKQNLTELFSQDGEMLNMINDYVQTPTTFRSRAKLRMFGGCIRIGTCNNNETLADLLAQIMQYHTEACSRIPCFVDKSCPPVPDTCAPCPKRDGCNKCLPCPLPDGCPPIAPGKKCPDAPKCEVCATPSPPYIEPSTTSTTSSTPKPFDIFDDSEYYEPPEIKSSTTSTSTTTSTTKPSETTSKREVIVSRGTKNLGELSKEFIKFKLGTVSPKNSDEMNPKFDCMNGKELFEWHMKFVIRSDQARVKIRSVIDRMPESVGGDEMLLAKKILISFGEKPEEPIKRRGSSRLFTFNKCKNNVMSILGHLLSRFMRSLCKCPTCPIRKICTCPPEPVCTKPTVCPPCPALKTCPAPAGCKEYPVCEKCNATKFKLDDVDPVDPIENINRPVSTRCQGPICKFNSICGEAELNPLSPKKSQTYMNGGEDEKYGEWPSFARIKIRSSNVRGLCGGVLISDRHVLTAEHCARTKIVSNSSGGDTKFNASNYVVFLADHMKGIKDSFEQASRVASLCHSSKFSDPKGDGSRYDYAILKLSEPVKFNQHVQPACLPYTFSPIKPEQQCFVVGLGVKNTTASGQNVKIVQKMRLKTASCEAWGFDWRDRSRHCFTKLGANGDTCDGDSGGPVLCLLKGRWTVAGIVSYGSENCDGSDITNWVGVYTKVPHLMEQIQKDCLLV